ncbi:MAG: nucleoside-diphosphate-sugar epimerase [Alteromonas sp.]|nr:nucleoside-diphosphate-sugar epimerase [Alteromonas sp.]MAY22870.1 nucleoside-diphosphate-sugar epimerase [Flavobacteriaceae bacterium]
MKKILITGSTGFVGSNLVPYLKESGFEVVGISRKGNLPTLTYESLNSMLWDEAYAMVHLAGKAHDLKKVSSESDYFEVNTELTKKLFDAFLKSKASVFIYMSSVKAVADKVSGTLTEEVVANPLTVYGKSKWAAEEYLMAQRLPEGKYVYILRPCMIHGPNNKGNLNLLYQFVNKGLPFPLGKFQNQRSFLSVGNLCFITLQLFQQQPNSGIYNLSDDGSISTVQLVRLMAEVTGKKARILNIPKPLIFAIASVGGWARLPINRERIDKLTENYVVSNSKIKKVLQIELPLSLTEGLKRTIKSFSAP